MNSTGARALIDVLLEQGVDTVFGYPAVRCSISTMNFTNAIKFAIYSPATSRRRLTRRTLRPRNWQNGSRYCDLGTVPPIS